MPSRRYGARLGKASDSIRPGAGTLLEGPGAGTALFVTQASRAGLQLEAHRSKRPARDAGATLAARSDPWAQA